MSLLALLVIAHPEGADFRDVQLKGADLSSATGLTQGQIESAIVDEDTRLPSSLQSPAQAESKADE